MPEGTADVPVNQLIAVLAGEGEDAQGGRRIGEPRAPAPKPAEAPQAAEAPKAAAPRAQRRQRPRSAEAGAAQPAPAAAPATNGHARIFSSPLARRLAKEAGIDLARIAGTGPHGRVVARDVEAAKEGKGLKAPGAAPARRGRCAVDRADAVRRQGARAVTRKAPTRSCRTTTCAA